MKRLASGLLIVCLLALLGTGLFVATQCRSTAPYDRAVSLKIHYRTWDKEAKTWGETASLTVTDANEIADIGSCMKVVGFHDADIFSIPPQTVEFTYEDGSVSNVGLLRWGEEYVLQKENEGTLILEDSKFHDKIREVISKKTGKPYP